MINVDCGCYCPQDPKSQQRYTLAVFYYSTDGPNWNECSAALNCSDPVAVANANANCGRSRVLVDPFNVPTFFGTEAWLSPGSECLWGGVECRSDSLCVDRLEFDNNGLLGTIPTELQALTEMRYVLLERDNLVGTIPTELGVLPLTVLDLNGNSVTGTIPTEIFVFGSIPGTFAGLLQLDLDTNQLIGTIPTVVGVPLFLQFIQVQGNQLTGTIPTEVGNLAFINTAEFFLNQFTGTVPEELCPLRTDVVSVTPPFLTKLTADCNPVLISSPNFVNCSCCSDCPLTLT